MVHLVSLYVRATRRLRPPTAAPKAGLLALDYLGTPLYSKGDITELVA